MSTIVIVCATLSAAFESIGLALVVRAVVVDRRRAADLFPSVAELELAAVAHPTASLKTKVIRAQPATGEGRIDELEEELRLVADQAEAHALAIGQTLSAQFTSAVNDVRGELAKQDTLLRDHLHAVLVESGAERLLGVGLLALGIAFGAAANIVGAA